MSDEPELWPEGQLPRVLPKPNFGNFKSLKHPLWTEHKARLIQEYLRLFVFITKHGTYIDGFAAPQNAQHQDFWSAKLVLESEPKRLRDFWLCDVDPLGVEKLRELQTEHQSRSRRITVLSGDFNQTVHTVLDAGRITEKTATFALLDQRTFECEWATVELLSRYKKGNKIELFYFFPSGWIDRSIGAVRADRTRDKVKRWWGRDDWSILRGMDGVTRAQLVAKRFEKEFGYKSSFPYAIHSRKYGGRTMYHMIHATDHPEAPPLMIRAYRKISGRSELADIELQRDMNDLWGDLLRDE